MAKPIAKYAAPQFVAYVGEIVGYLHRNRLLYEDGSPRATSYWADAIRVIEMLVLLATTPIDQPLPPSFVIPELPSDSPPRPYWQPDRALHRKATSVVPEINRWLNRVESERWSCESANAIAILESPSLDSDEGQRIAREWIRLGIELLEAIDQALLVFPEGRPFILVKVDVPAVNPIVAKLSRMLDEDPALRSLKPTALIKQAKVQRQAGLSALRSLSDRGLYRGYSRPPQSRIADRPARTG